MSEVAAQIVDLHKSFDKVTALNGVNLEVRAGELFGVIGSDGGGKTTLFRILTGLLVPSKGQARVFGLDCVKDFRAIRLKIGYMPGRFSLYQDLTVEENLNFFATVFGVRPEQNEEIIGPIYSQIAPFKTRRAGQLSGGMKQKLALSCALVHRPELLILDEPTTGVDAVSRAEFWEVLQDLKKDGMTILVSTPYMDEAAQCDRIALMQDGRLLHMDTPENVVRQFSKPIFALRAPRSASLLNHLRALPECEAVYPFGEVIHFIDRGHSVTPQSLQRTLADAGWPDTSATAAVPTIEDTFMFLMRADGNRHSG